MYVRTTCAVKANEASAELVQKLKDLGINPIVTSQVVRGVYEGTDEVLAKRIVEVFQQEQNPDIFYDDGRREQDEIAMQCQNRERAGAQSNNVVDKKRRKRRVQRNRR